MLGHHDVNRLAGIMYIQMENWFGSCRWKDVIATLAKIIVTNQSDRRKSSQVSTHICNMLLHPFGVSLTLIFLFIYIRNSVRQYNPYHL